LSACSLDDLFLGSRRHVGGAEFPFFPRLCEGWTVDTKYTPGVSFHDPSLCQFKARNTVHSCSTENFNLAAQRIASLNALVATSP
jgi:hypothetical protein